MIALWQSEPALVSGAVLAVVQALIAVFVAFGAPVTKEQSAAILGLSSAVLALVAVFVIRSQVAPVAKSAAN